MKAPTDFDINTYFAKVLEKQNLLDITNYHLHISYLRNNFDIEHTSNI